MRCKDGIVTVGWPFETHGKMGLLKVFHHPPLATCEIGRGFGRCVAARQRGEERFGLFDKRIMIHSASGGEDHILGAVILRHEVFEVVACEGFDALGRAKNGPAQGLLGVGLFLKPVKDHIIGGIQRLTDLLQDHAALYLDFAGVEHWIHKDIADHVDRKRHITRQNARVIGCGFAAGVGIDIAADIFDGFGNIKS